LRSAPHKSCMYIIGSLPSLGSWDAKKARRMHADEDGRGWTLSFYIPEKVEFLYQYFLADESSSDGGDPKILWEVGSPFLHSPPPPPHPPPPPPPSLFIHPAPVLLPLPHILMQSVAEMHLTAFHRAG
jgi:hypothetical protein